jgi:hypothetical protein
MKRSSAPLFIAAALAAACTAEDDGLGRIDVSLVGHAASGASYRLRDAILTVSGPASLTFRSEDQPDRTLITARVPSGPYTLSVAPGWRLERLASGGAEPVAATLTTPDPLPFAVTAGGFTPVTLRFRAGGDDVGMGDGDIGIGIGVDEAVDAGVLDAPMPDAAIDAAIDAPLPAQAIVANPLWLSVAEGTATTLMVHLAAPPPAPIAVTVTSSDASMLSASPAQLVFTPADFAVPRAVTVQSVQDDDLAGGIASVRLVAPGLPQVDVVAAITDDDVQAIVFNPSALTTIEGQGTAFSARLAYRPSNPVTVTFTTSDASRVTISHPATRTFGPGDWFLEQFVGVDAVVDDDSSAQIYTVTGAAPGLAGELAVTVFEAFSAGWPDPGSLSSITGGTLVMAAVDIAAPVTIQRMQVTGSGTGSMRIAIYADASDTPGAFIVSSQAQGFSPFPTPTSQPVVPIQLAAGRYWIGVAVYGSGNQIASGAPSTSVRRCSRTVTGNSFPPGPNGFTCSTGTAPSVAVLGHF